MRYERIELSPIRFSIVVEPRLFYMARVTADSGYDETKRIISNKADKEKMMDKGTMIMC